MVTKFVGKTLAIAAIAAATAAFGANIQITSSADDLPLPNWDGSFSGVSSRGSSVRHIYYIISEAKYTAYTSADSTSEAIYGAFLAGELGEACLYDEIKTSGYSNINLNEIFWKQEGGENYNYDAYYGNGVNAYFAAIYTYTNETTGAFYYIAQPTNTVTLTAQELDANPFAHRRITNIAIAGGRWNYIPSTYTISYFGNEGIGDMPEQTATNGIPTKLAANAFIRIGYSFAGWALSANGTAICNDEDNLDSMDYHYAAGESVNLYAVWVERDWAMPDYLDAPGLTFETEGGLEWSGDQEEFKVGGASLTSGELPPSAVDGERTNIVLRTTVIGEGSLSFWWRVSCEQEDKDYDEWYDFATFTVDGVEVAKVAGESGWRQVECDVVGAGTHVLEWAFFRDDYDEDGADYGNALWVDGVEWTPVPVTVLAEAVDAEALAFTTGGTKEWTVDAATGWTNGVSAKSGVVTNGSQSSWIETTVTGGGTLAFRWKVMGGIHRNNPFAYAKVEVDGTQVASNHLTDGWKGQTLTVEGAGTHTIRWTYLRTSARPAEGDCAWLDGVSWEAAAAETAMTPEPVPYEWLVDNGLASAGASAAAMEAAANATARNGRPVWECYVADLDPGDENSDLVAEIAFDESGKPVVSIAKGESPNRKYTTQGARSLGGTGQWDDLEEGADWAAQGYRFFRVKVEIP